MSGLLLYMKNKVIKLLKQADLTATRGEKEKAHEDIGCL